ncbi:MAG: hypothetical protein ACOY40_06205 [Bacillota bacterium]
MCRQVKINLQGLSLGRLTSDEARKLIMEIRGIELVEFEPGEREAVIVGNTSLNSPDEILRAILEAKLKFSRYYLTEQSYD